MSTDAAALGAATAPALDEVLDQHAELRDLIAQLREAADTGMLSGLLQRLHDLLQGHFAHEEANPELRRMLADAPAPPQGCARSLLDDHHGILTALEQLVARVESAEPRTVEPFAAEVTALLARVAAHDARETSLFGARIDVPAAATPAPDSQALAVNLRRTAVDVVIPPEQTVLLEITASRYGVHESTRKLLREVNHRYASWPETLEELHRRAMGDLPCYLEHARAADAVQVFGALYARVVESARDDAVRETAVRRWGAYLTKVVDSAGPRLPCLVPVLKATASRLDVVLRESPRLAVSASATLRALARRLSEASPPQDEELRQRVLSLLVGSLRCVYTAWLAQPDPAAWWRARRAGTALPEALATISHARQRERLTHLEQLAASPAALAANAEPLLALPDDTWIARAHLDATPCIDGGDGNAGGIARIDWLIHVLSIEALASVHRQALTEIDHAWRGALAQADDERFAALVRETFAALCRSPLATSPAAFGLLGRVGVEVLRHGDPGRAALVVDALLDWPFPTPGFAGFTDEWRVRVDPAHLPAIRAHLAVIGANPSLALPLVLALTVRLRVGGIFVADTDLFQRDVSELLNSDIAPVYQPVKQLLRLFPVYFSDIGAEGELRDVSSRIDEIHARKDPLCHFLRKQCHVECNPRLVPFIDAIDVYWTEGDAEPLRPFVPPSLYERVATRPDPRPIDPETRSLLLRLRELVCQKYALDHADLLDRLARFHRVAPNELDTLREALRTDRHEEALSILLDVLERVKEIALHPERSEGHEEIYRKRHIAVGIPSMYGRYREEKLEAMGLGFRVESLANALFERLVAADGLAVPSRDGLRLAARLLRLLLRAIRVDGFHGRGLEVGTAMLEHALDAPGTTLDQYANLFQILSRGIEQLIRLRFALPFEELLARVLPPLQAEDCADDDPATRRERTLKGSEAFLRHAIASSFGIQPLDRLVARLLRGLAEARDRLDPAAAGRLVAFDLERSCLPIDAPPGPLDDPVFLGNKGALIRRLAAQGLPVPPGFVLTTEVFRALPAVQGAPALYHALRERIRSGVARIERATGARFGDAAQPLLLSVRSGAAISMPGVLDTFLDVGVNERITEGLARQRSAWGAWDAYRRFLQFWGMGHGIARDRFDALMREAKAAHRVQKKAQIRADAMRALALRYRRLVEGEGVVVPDDPHEQLERCIALVLASWHAEKARIYRAELQIAEDWGTAVVVQAMVYGNLDARCGTGVALTCDPRLPSDEVQLTGDFAVQAQGDDVVSGLVETFPIGEAQRQHERPDAPGSLEHDFPRIHAALLAHARALLRQQDLFHQEIEFTFESDDPADLYLLQTRDVVMAELDSVAAFVPGPALERDRLAHGIGAGGGALSGRVARDAEEIARLRQRHPDDPILLVRPDTVPDDIPLILASDGLLTALGGATSHAAIVAQRLGRSCVVGCRALVVEDARGNTTIGTHPLVPGEFVSISGIDGSVYRGRHRTTTVRRRRLL